MSELQDSLTQNPFGVPASSVTAASQAKQTGYGALTPPQRRMRYKKSGAVNQPVFVDVDLAERNTTIILFYDYATITKG